MTVEDLDRPIVVGTRGSKLATAQTRWFVDRLRETRPGLRVEIRTITTRGDRLRGRPLPEIGGKGLFTEELDRSLLDGSIDLAVHSAKDLPTDTAAGLAILAVPPREDPRDAWVSPHGPFEFLPAGAAVGTGSLRRQAQLLMRRPDLTFVPLRGNVDTRIAKMRRGECAGAVLAMAGLIRLGLADQIVHPFEADVLLPAPGQGALAIEGRADDPRVRGLVESVNDPVAALALNAERSLLHRLDAGCRAPVGILAEIDGPTLRIRALVSDPGGRRIARAQACGSAENAEAVADGVMEQLVRGGAREIIAACR